MNGIGKSRIEPGFELRPVRLLYEVKDPLLDLRIAVEQGFEPCRVVQYLIGKNTEMVRQ